MQDDEAQILALLEALSEAIRTKDAARAVAPYAKPNVMFTLEPPLQFKSESSPGQEGVQEWFDTWEGPIGYESREVQVAVSGDVAYSHGLTRISGTKTDGETTEVWVRETNGFRKIGGEWRISHQHQSVPFLMYGSGLAALDLKP